MITAKSIIEQLALTAHPEGGYYKETYRSDDIFPKSALPTRYTGDRCAATAIFYLLEAGDFSALHRVQSDELFHFYLGGPVEILVISPQNEVETAVIGNDIAAGHQPQFLVHKGSIQGLRPLPGAPFSLLGATVAPGFEFADFELISRAEIIDDFPRFAEIISALTRIPI